MPRKMTFPSRAHAQKEKVTRHEKLPAEVEAVVPRLRLLAPGEGRIPDETTSPNFRHLLERRTLTEAIFTAVNAHLAGTGLTLRSGRLEDATTIGAAGSTQNEAGRRAPQTGGAGGQWLVFRHEGAWRRPRAEVRPIRRRRGVDRTFRGISRVSLELTLSAA